MGLDHNQVADDWFNRDAVLPFELRLSDVHMAMQDVYDFFFDVNRFLLGKGLQRLDDMLRPAIMSGDRAGGQQATGGLHGGLSGPGYRGGFPPECTQRTGHADGHLPSRWHPEAAGQLGL